MRSGSKQRRSIFGRPTVAAPWSLALVLGISAAFGNAANDPPVPPDSEDDDAFLEQWLRGEDLDDLSDLILPEESQWQIPGLEERLPAPPLWDLETKFKTGGGYRDNVLSSAKETEGGGFLLAGFETMLLRIDERMQWVMALEAEHLAFAFDRDLPNDTFASGFSQITLPLAGDWTGSFLIRSFYLDQVVRVASADQPDLAALRTRGLGIAAAPSLRKSWPTAFYAEVSGSAAWHRFRAPLWDYWQYGPKGTAGWKTEDREVALSVEHLWRHYDDRPNLTSEGAPIEGSTLRLEILRPQLSFRRTWGEDNRWRASGRLGVEFHRDNGSGYFDHDGFRLSQRLGYRTGAWELEGRAEYSAYRFDLQRAGDDGPLLRRDWREIALEARREVAEQMEVFARYSHEQAGSNNPELRYTVNTWAAGVGWKF